MIWNIEFYLIVSRRLKCDLINVMGHLHPVSQRPVSVLEVEVRLFAEIFVHLIAQASPFLANLELVERQLNFSSGSETKIQVFTLRIGL